MEFSPAGEPAKTPDATVISTELTPAEQLALAHEYEKLQSLPPETRLEFSTMLYLTHGVLAHSFYRHD